MGRRIIGITNDRLAVAQEAQFELEARLHGAIAAHPEVLPNGDFGLGPLVSLATELDLGSGPMDLLAADAQGHLAIVEFKRGSENLDVRQVVAQLLDYGASLWRHDYETIEARCREAAPGFAGSLVEYMHDRLEPLTGPFDEDMFRSGVEASLDSRVFAFVYCGWNLDDRTRRTMTYLAEGPRMNVFAVEVDYYREGANEEAVLVPRAAFVPSWVIGLASAAPRRGESRSTPADPSPEYQDLIERMDQLARDLGLEVLTPRSGRMYRPAVLEADVTGATGGIGVYQSSRGVEFSLAVLRERGQAELADDLLHRLEGLSGRSLQGARNYPSVPYTALLQDWGRARHEVIEPYIRAKVPVHQTASVSSRGYSTGASILSARPSEKHWSDGSTDAGGVP